MNTYPKPETKLLTDYCKILHDHAAGDKQVDVDLSLKDALCKGLVIDVDTAAQILNQLVKLQIVKFRWNEKTFATAVVFNCAFYSIIQGKNKL